MVLCIRELLDYIYFEEANFCYKIELPIVPFAIAKYYRGSTAETIEATIHSTKKTISSAGKNNSTIRETESSLFSIISTHKRETKLIYTYRLSMCTSKHF